LWTWKDSILSPFAWPATSLSSPTSAHRAMVGPSHWGFVARALGLRMGPGLGFGLVCGCGGGARPHVLSALLMGPSGHHPLPFLASFATRTRAHQWALKALPGIFCNLHQGRSQGASWHPL
jgi:hypothetical protein